MSTFQIALQHVRRGGEMKRGSQRVRHLTTDEAAPILLARKPSRQPKRNEDGELVYDKNKQMVIETVAPNVDPKRLGLFDVSVDPPVEFRPTDEDVGAEWRVDNEEDPEPEVVPPETVDEVLTPIDEPLAIEDDVI